MDFNVGLYSEKINISTDVPLSRYSFLKTGGNAEILAFPRSPEEVVILLREAGRTATPVTVIGGTTNTLISDSGIRGLVISTKNLKGITMKGSLVIAAAGESMDNVINKSIEHNLKGLERLGGLPGTVGGAIFGNSGANGLEAGDLCFYIDYISKDGMPRRMAHYCDSFSYRRGPLKSGDIILAAAFRLIPALNTVEAKLEKERFQRERIDKGAFLYPSIGCFFKNPDGESAGRIMDELGLKGMKVGDAMVSDYNANILINTGEATSRDFFDLSQKIREIVKKERGIDLEYEIKLMGEF